MPYIPPTNDTEYAMEEAEEIEEMSADTEDDNDNEADYEGPLDDFGYDGPNDIGVPDSDSTTPDSDTPEETISYLRVTYRERSDIPNYDPYYLEEQADNGAIFYAIYDDDTEVQVSWDEIQDLDPLSTEIDLSDSIASASNQHFWDDENGAHVAEISHEDWDEAVEDNFSDLSASKNYYNFLINSLGGLLRRALLNLVSINRGAISFYDGLGNAANNIMASFGRYSAQIGKSNEKHVVIDNSGITAYNGDGSLAPMTGLFDGANINNSSITNAKIADSTITGSKIQGATLTDIPYAAIDDADIEVARVANAQISSATISQAQIENLASDYAHITNGTIDNAKIDKADVNGLSATYATITNLNAATGRIGTLETDNASIKGRLTAAEGTIENLDSNYAHITNGTIDNAKIDKADVNGLSATYATITNLNATTGRIGTLETDNASIKGRLTAAEANVTSLQANKVNVTDLEADYITADTIDVNYVKTDMSNTDVAWIQNGTIKDGAITNAMINSVSANKLTAGTIDASNITVTNLNASNITTGTINGQRIGEGSLSLSKLEDDVYTEDEVDALLSTMQSEIDGAIETWTGTAVPTLSNAPASGWADSATKDRHVGDVYFVVNSQSQQNGYNYRFTKSGSTYSWQLIKDSDVTAALQRLTTAEGKIGTIEQFDTTVSSFMTDTDEEIASIKSAATTLSGRVDTAEGQIATKVEQSSFNTLSQTVSGNSSSIQTLTTEQTTLSGLVSTALTDSIEYIEGTQTVATDLWTGVTRETSLTAGKSIAYKLPVAGTSTAATLNLTLAGGGTTGAKEIKMPYSTSSNTATLQNVTTHYPVGSIINMTYDGTQWVIANYNTNVNQVDRTVHSNTLMSASANATGKSYAVIASSIIGYVSSLNGYQTILVGTVVDLRWAILWGTGNVATSKTFTNAYEVYPSCTLRNNAASNWAGTQYDTAYIYGTLSGNSLTVVGFTSTVPASEDGYVYIPLGQLYSTYQIAFRSSTQKYAYLDGAFQPVEWGVKSQTAKTITKVNDVSDTVDGHTQRIGSLETTITTKADGSALETVSNNLSTLSQTVDTFQTTVASTYATKESVDNIQIGGRNLLRYMIYNYADANDVIGVSSAYRGMYCAVDGGETYTISRRTVEGNRFWIEWSEQEPASGVALHKLSQNNGALKVTVDIPSEANWLFIYLSNQSDIINDGNIKVERGNKATDWTPAPEDMAASSDLTALTTRVSTAESTIEQHSDSIALKANSADVYTKTQSDGLISTEVTNRDAAISAATNAINLSVSQTYSTKTETADAIDDISIGGRNLFTSSADFYDNWNKESATVTDGVATITKAASGNSRIYQMPSRGHWTWDAGKIFTVSVDACGAVGGETLRLSATQTGAYKNFVLTTEWVRYSYTFTVITSSTGSMAFMNLGDTDSVIYIRNPKLERGNKATDWSPAPEDLVRNPNILRSTNQNIDLVSFADTATALWSQGKWGISSGTASSGSAELVRFDDAPDGQLYGFRVWSTTGNKDVAQRELQDALEPSVTYQFTCYARLTPGITQSSATAQIRLYGYATSSATTASALTTATKTLSSTEWTRLWYTITLTEAHFANVNKVKTLLVGVSGAGDIQLCGLKLERSNYVTGWAPSPFDAASATSFASMSLTVDGINTEVAKKVNGTEIISTINQSAESVQIQASKVEITGNAVFSAINNDTGTTKISGGKIDATSITIGQSQVTNLTSDLASKATPNDITTAINAIEVGGRNLLRYMIYNYADANDVIGVSSAYRGMYCAVDGGETYTISRRTVEGNRFWIEWSEQEPASGVALHKLSQNNGALKVTVDIPSEANWLFIYLSNQSDIINDGNIKVERGNKATDWTPAPEDQSAYVDTSINAIEVGGRNLVLATNYAIPDTMTKPSDNARVVKRYFLSSYASDAIKNGTKLTATFEAKVSNGTWPVQVYIGYMDGETATSIVNGGSPYPMLTTEWAKISRVMDFNSDLVPTWIQVTASTATGTNGVTYSIRGLKLEFGTKSTDWSPAPEDVASDISSVQDNLNATRTWYATCPTAGGTAAKVATITPETTDFTLASLVAGVTIAVKFDAANTVAAPTLNVNGTGDIDIKRYGTTAPSTSAATSWQAGSVATLTYDGTYWQLNNWLNNNDNYYDREQYKAALAASTTISAARIGVLGTDGKLKLLAESGAFDITGPVLYVNTAYSADNVTAGTTRTSNYTFWGTAFNLTNTHAITGAAAGKPVYIVGTLSGKTFTPNSTVLTCTVPTSVDNLVYMRLGIMSTTANAVLESQHPLYMYFNGAFQQCDPATADAAKTATNFISLDSTGIRIANADPATATTYQHQTSTKTEFVVGNTSMAEIGGNGARFGATAESHLTLDYHSMQLVDKEGDTYFHVSDLRGADGSTTFTETFVAGGSDTQFDLALMSDTTDYEVSVDDVPYEELVHPPTRAKSYVRFTSVPSAGSVIVVTYPTSDKKAKAYTLGLRSPYGNAVGVMSLVEGYNNSATAYASHAEGISSRADGHASHAECGYNQATGDFSHAEGISSRASGREAHAEGDHTIASGTASHAEGSDTTASGLEAHAEGSDTIASGRYSHAQNRYTVAGYESQTAIGKYNDNQSTNAFEIGNGTSDSARSNAFAVDWYGNIYAAEAILSGLFNAAKAAITKDANDTGTTALTINDGTNDVIAIDWSGNLVLAGGITLGTTLADANLPTKGSSGTAGTSSATSGATLAVPYLTTDAYGRVTAKGTHTHTINSLAASVISSGTLAEARMPAGWVKQYMAGDTISGNVRCMGFVTSSTKSLRFTIPLSKPVQNAVTFNSMTIIPRGETGTLSTITPTSSQVTLSRSPSGIDVDYDASAAISGMTNNHAYALQVSYSFVVQS